MFPEVRHTIYAVSAGECLLQALDVVEIGLDHFSALGGEGLRFVFIWISSDRAAGKLAGLIVQNCATETPSLRTGRTHYCDDFLISHVCLLYADESSFENWSKREHSPPKLGGVAAPLRK